MSGTTPPDTNASWDEDSDPKDEYRKRGLLGQKTGSGSTEEERSLHTFFSPLAVPAGMTDEEVRTCIRLYPLIEALKKRDEAMWGILPGLIDPLIIAEGFHGPGPMTRERFKAAIDAFVANVALAINPPLDSGPREKNVTETLRVLEGG
jgi:hypothetical protein